MNDALIPAERIEQAILLIRGQKVMLDQDLAALYGVETGALNRAVARNADRFPDDFMFQLTGEEFENLKCQLGMASHWGGRRTPPYAFSEQGVAMLSGVLRSPQAVKVNIAIMRAFVKLREILASHADLARRLDDMERKTTASSKSFSTPSANSWPHLSRPNAKSASEERCGKILLGTGFICR